jgi:tellurite resistance protein TehA-like permease
MSDEPSGMPGPGADTSGLAAITGRLSDPGELVIAAGAVLVVAVDLLGDIILDEYSFARVAWVAALLILFVVVAHRWSERPLFASYGRALVVLGLVAGAAVARGLVSDVENEYLDDGGTYLVMALIFYLGGALLLVGAWQRWSAEDGD